MGYRLRLSRLPKDSVETFSRLSFEELNEKIKVEEDDSFRELPDQRELLTLQCEISDEFKEKYTLPFFKMFDIKKMNEHDYCIVDKNGLKEIVDLYNDEIVELLSDQIEQIEKGKTDIGLFNLMQKRDRWNLTIGDHKIRPYKLKETNNDKMMDGAIVSDGAMEYQIFNVVFIYNTFDWDKDVLILSGW